MTKNTFNNHKIKPKTQTLILKLKEFELTLNLCQNLTHSQLMKIEKKINSLVKEYLKSPQFDIIEIRGEL